MTDIHLPDLDDEDHPAAAAAGVKGTTAVPQSHAAAGRSRSLLKFALEILLIATGVFLGLMGEQWRSRNEHRELAQEALRRFRSELTANRTAVASVQDYHVKMRAAINEYFATPRPDRASHIVRIQGIQPVLFERTAWDLALATQSLTYVDPAIAFALSEVYTLQEQYASQTRNIMLSVYLQPPAIAPEPLLGALREYYGDLVIWEPRLLVKYDALTPMIDRALGGTAGRTLNPEP